MLIDKGISISRLIKLSGGHILWLLVSSTIIASLYRFDILDIALPWLPISVIGTAVAFYVGFKNSQAYDRMWEARKIWGAIVNSSRAWGMNVDTFVNNQSSESDASDEALHSIKKRLIYRHFAWLYSLRSQLLVPTPWEHISQDGHIGRTAEAYQRKSGVGLIDDEQGQTDLNQFLTKDEFDRLGAHKNTATQIINEQARDLRDLRKLGLIDDFRHMRMTDVLYHFYEHQGKAERIKKFPLPRQYANMSRYFVGIFLMLVPFSMIPELMKLGEEGYWLSILVTALIGWVYVMMEVVGDYSENPFQGMANDIPMLSLCRTIEIDLREMLGEIDLPPAIEAKKGVLM